MVNHKFPTLAWGAVVGVWAIVVGGHTAEAGWFRNRTDTYHNDCFVLDRSGVVQWRAAAVGGDLPAPRELHSLTALSGGRLLLFGGRDPAGVLQWMCLHILQLYVRFRLNKGHWAPRSCLTPSQPSPGVGCCCSEVQTRHALTALWGAACCCCLELWAPAAG